MNKPGKETHEFYDYQKCSEYIAQKLGVKSLRDFDGKYSGNENAEYKDFWHFMTGTQEVHNGCFIYIDGDLFLQNMEDWQKCIIEAFIEEFGEATKYWVEW